jgi:protocatechuate 3,4-dioxygenase beta subunit
MIHVIAEVALDPGSASAEKSERDSHHARYAVVLALSFGQSASFLISSLSPLARGARLMQPPIYHPSRRIFLGLGASAAALFMTRGLFAEQLIRTPSLTEGPFYPDKLPLDTDNDLLIINDHITPAVGEVTYLTGRVLVPTGSPVPNVTVEIWQCDANAVYLHTGDSGSARNRQDRNFQGFGRFTTGSSGEYYFRTIKPVPYPGRPAPHIHVKVKRGGRELLTTQIFVNGHPGNSNDGVFLGVDDPIDRELVLADFKPVPDSKIGELTAQFDIVLGRTPDERSLQRKRPSAV